MRYRMTDTGTERVADDGTVTVIVAETPEYAEFYQWLLAGNHPEPLPEPEPPPAPSKEEQIAAALAQLQALTAQITALSAA